MRGIERRPVGRPLTGGTVKLGTLLLRDAVISLGQLEAALRAQVLYGGRLGTNLVELGFVDLDTLGVYLGRISGAPVASRDRFERAPAASIQTFDRELAELYVAFPLGADPDNPEALAVAPADPTDDDSVSQLAGQCECPIVPYIAPELRIYYHLEKHFGLRRKARFVRAGVRREAPHALDERRRAQPAHGIEMPPAVRFEPKKRADTEPRGLAGADAAAAAPPAERPAPRATADEIAALLGEAESRDAIATAFTEYAVGRFDACVVFLLRDANAIGWRAHTLASTAARDDIEALSLPLGGASGLQAAHDSRAPYRGAPPTAGRPIETRLWQALGVSRAPRELLVVPVLVKARVVNLVYAHNEGGRLDDAHVEELTRLAGPASDAYVPLIQATRTVGLTLPPRLGRLRRPDPGHAHRARLAHLRPLVGHVADNDGGRG